MDETLPNRDSCSNLTHQTISQGCNPRKCQATSPHHQDLGPLRSHTSKASSLSGSFGPHTWQQTLAHRAKPWVYFREIGAAWGVSIAQSQKLPHAVWAAIPNQSCPRVPTGSNRPHICMWTMVKAQLMPQPVASKPTKVSQMPERAAFCFGLPSR